MVGRGNSREQTRCASRSQRSCACVDDERTGRSNGERGELARDVERERAGRAAGASAKIEDAHAAPRPAAQRPPAVQLLVAAARKRAHALADTMTGLIFCRPQPERQGDRHRRVAPAAQYSARRDHHHGGAALAPEAAHVHGRLLGKIAQRVNAQLQAPAPPVAHEADALARRGARRATRRAARRARRRHRRRSRRPRLDVQTKVDDSTFAPPQSARSTTGAQSWRIGPPSPFRLQEKSATRRCAASSGDALYSVSGAQPQFSAMPIRPVAERFPSRCVHGTPTRTLSRAAR